MQYPLKEQNLKSILRWSQSYNNRESAILNLDADDMTYMKKQNTIKQNKKTKQEKKRQRKKQNKTKIKQKQMHISLNIWSM